MTLHEEIRILEWSEAFLGLSTIALDVIALVFIIVNFLGYPQQGGGGVEDL